MTPVALQELSSQDVANNEDSDTVCEECKLRNCPVGWPANSVTDGFTPDVWTFLSKISMVTHIYVYVF